MPLRLVPPFMLIGASCQAGQGGGFELLATLPLAPA
jgi:hypothetical protein